MRLFSFTVCFQVTLLFSAFWISAANAQIVNIEEGRVDRDSSNYIAGKAGLNFSLYNQNAGKNQPNNFLQLIFNANPAYISPKHSYLLVNYINYLLVNFNSDSLRNTVAKTGYSHFRVNLFRERRLSYEFFAQVQADKTRGLELRVLSGANLRYKVTRYEHKLTIYLGTGLMYEHETWINPQQEGQVRISDLPKSTNYVSAKFKPNDILEVNGIAYYQFGYSGRIDRFRNRVSGDISLNVKLSNVFGFKTNFNCTYEDEPIVPVTKFVYSLSNGIEVSF